MIELRKDELRFSFPEVHPDAKVSVEFQRTFRIPDDGDDYPLPPGFGRFPLRHVDDFAAEVPEDWVTHGGVMLPMYQSEALWINFNGHYPFALRVATGKIDALTGKEWSNGLHRRPQDYLVVPDQPWLDGYCVEEGLIRQFVAMPLGSGYSTEEQLTDEAKYGGLQIAAYPMKAEAYEKLGITRRAFEDLDYCLKLGSGMGLAPGGKMRQEIYEDTYKLSDWDLAHCSRCFVHIANSLVWQSITGNHPPTVPPTAKMYNEAGLPWFEYYRDGGKALAGAAKLKKLKSIVSLGQEEGEVPLPENKSVNPQKVIELRANPIKDQVREGEF